MVNTGINWALVDLDSKNFTITLRKYSKLISSSSLTLRIEDTEPDRISSDCVPNELTLGEYSGVGDLARSMITG